MRSSSVAAFVIAGTFAASAHDARAQQPIEGVSVNADGTIFGAQDFNRPSLSPDGRWVAISSGADLAGGDQNTQIDVFVRDRVNHVSILMSVATDGTQANAQCFQPSISSDGRFVAFSSWATNLDSVDTNNLPDVFLHDRDPDGNGIFDEPGATTILLSKKWDGSASDDDSFEPAVAGDGSVVAFVSGSNLTPDADGMINLFLYDVAAGTLQCITTGMDGQGSGGDSHHPSLSADGKLLAFQSWSPRLVPHDTNGNQDVFVWNRENGVMRRMSVATDGTEANDGCVDAAISADGSTVVFTSEATNLVTPATDGRHHVFVRARGEQVTTLLTQLPDGTFANGHSLNPAVSGDGRFVAFDTTANNLVERDDNLDTDVLLADRDAGTFETISADCMGFTGSGHSTYPAISPDGRFIAFDSDAWDLADEQFGGDMIYLRDRTISWPMASATTYGDGWAGTLGIPALTASTLPQYGATIDLSFDNSAGFWNVGFLLLGMQQAELPTAKDGTLLVAIADIIPLALNPAGTIVQGAIPFDAALCGFELDLQGIELDPGASKGVAFTPGLQLMIGR
jgi:Tol biopolymer transport system component